MARIGSFRITRKPSVSIGRVVTKLVMSALIMWTGGVTLNVIGEILNGTASPFYTGFRLLGWTVVTVTNSTSQESCATNNAGAGNSGPSIPNCITNTTGAGILTVIGLIAIATILLEFISINRM